jgi:hypothetical protein
MNDKWKTSKFKDRICIDITGQEINRLIKMQENKDFDKKDLKLIKEIQTRLIDTYILLLELGEIHKKQKSYPLGALGDPPKKKKKVDKK